MALTLQQKQDILRSRGHDPANTYLDEASGYIYDGQDPSFDTQMQENISPPRVDISPKSSASTVFAKAAGTSFLPTAGGLGAGALGFRVPGPLPLKLAAGLATSIAGGSAVSALQEQIIPPSLYPTQQELEQHPVAGIAGQLAPSLMALDPIQSVKSLGRAGKDLGKILLSPKGKASLMADEITALKSVALQSGVGAGTQAGLNIYNQSRDDKPFDPWSFVRESVIGGVLNEPHRLGTKLFGFKPTYAGVKTQDQILSERAGLDDQLRAQQQTQQVTPSEVSDIGGLEYRPDLLAAQGRLPTNRAGQNSPYPPIKGLKGVETLLRKLPPNSPFHQREAALQEEALGRLEGEGGRVIEPPYTEPPQPQVVGKEPSFYQQPPIKGKGVQIQQRSDTGAPYKYSGAETEKPIQVAEDQLENILDRLLRKRALKLGQYGKGQIVNEKGEVILGSKGKPIVGRALPGQRQIDLASNPPNPQTVHHEVGHVQLMDLATSKDAGDRALVNRVFKELGRPDITAEEFVRLNQEEARLRGEGKKTEADVVRDQYIQAEEELMQYMGLEGARRELGTGKFKQWFKDYISRFGFGEKPARQQISAAQRYEAPYGTRGVEGEGSLGGAGKMAEDETPKLTRGSNETLTEFLARKRQAGELPSPKSYEQSIPELKQILSVLESKPDTSHNRWRINKTKQMIAYQEANPRGIEKNAEDETPYIPEVARENKTGSIKNKLGHYLGTSYHGTPEDYTRYNEIQKEFGNLKTKGLSLASPEGQALYKENETIKNKYGGMPPYPPKETNEKTRQDNQQPIIKPEEQVGETGSKQAGIKEELGKPKEQGQEPGKMSEEEERKYDRVPTEKEIKNLPRQYIFKQEDGKYTVVNEADDSAKANLSYDEAQELLRKQNITPSKYKPEDITDVAKTHEKYIEANTRSRRIQEQLGEASFKAAKEAEKDQKKVLEYERSLPENPLMATNEDYYQDLKESFAKANFKANEAEAFERPDVERHAEEERSYETFEPSLAKELRKDHPFGLIPLRDDKSLAGNYIADKLKVLPKIEQDLLKQAGFEDWLREKGKRVTKEEIASWLSKNGPQVKVESYGMEGKVSEARKEYDALKHEIDSHPLDRMRELADRVDLTATINRLEFKEPNGKYTYYQDLTDADVAILKRLHKLKQQVGQEPVDTSPRATSAYTQVSALPTNEPMPEWTKSKSGKNVQRVDVVLPESAGKEVTSSYAGNKKLHEALWSPDNLHENLPNTLGWAMIQYKTGPKEWRNKITGEVTQKDPIGETPVGRKATGLSAIQHVKSGEVYTDVTHATALNKLLEKYPNATEEDISSGWYRKGKYEEGAEAYKIWENDAREYLKNKREWEALPPNKIAVIAEAQSRWGQSVRETRKKTPSNDPLDPYARSESEIKKWADGMDHPLLRDYNRLILKAAIEQARKEGATHIMVSDAETAMMTEGHDLNATRLDIAEAGRLQDRRDRGELTPQQYAQEVIAAHSKSKQYEIDQEPGMRLNYDTILPKIAEELTGSKGEKVSLGEHKNAFKAKGTMEERGYETFHMSPEERTQYYKDINVPRENLIFKNPDGTPKTDVSGVMYPIKEVSAKLQQEPFSIAGSKFSESESQSYKTDPNLLPKKPLLSITTSVTDKIAESKRGSYIHEKVSNKMREYFNEAQSKEGYYGQSIVRAYQTGGYSPQEINNVYRHRWEKDNGLPTSRALSAKENKLNDTYQSLIQRPKEDGAALGLKVKRGESWDIGGVKPEGYLPNLIDPDVLWKLREAPDSIDARKYKRQWAEWLTKKGLGKEEATKMIEDYLRAQREYGDTGGPEFKALRRPEGYGLPWELMDKNPVRAALRYGRRAANDIAYFKHLQSDPEILQALGLKDQYGDNPKPSDKVTYIGSEKPVQDAMKFIWGKTESSNPRFAALMRLAGNLVMGHGTAIRNIAAIPTQMAPYDVRLRDIFNGLKNLASTRERAYESGAARINPAEFDYLGDIGNPDRVVRTLDNLSNILRKYQGRNLSDKMEAEVLYGIGEEWAKNMIATKNDVMLKRASGKADYKIPEKPSIKDIQDIAAGFVRLTRGSYGPQGLPSWALTGNVAPFVALNRFGIEKWNNVAKDVIQPMKQGNLKPFLKYTLSAVMTGAMIEQLNELLSNRKGSDANINETLAAYAETQKEEDLAHKIIGLMQLSSYAGIVGDMAKMASRASQGKEISYSNPIGLPLYTLATDTFGENLSAAVGALRDGEDPINVLAELSKSIPLQTIQAGRYLKGHMDEESSRKEAYRDIRVYKEATGKATREELKASKGNPYADIEAKKFKKTDDIEEAQRMLPTLIQAALKRAGNDPYKLKAEFRKLKANSFQVMPSPETQPIEFWNYFSYLRKSIGDEKASERLSKFFSQRLMNEAKSSMVP